MPRVYQITNYEVDSDGSGCSVGATTPPMLTNIRNVIEASLPGATCAPSRRRGLAMFGDDTIALVGLNGRTKDLEELLRCGSTSICVIDVCDATECLDFYRLPTQSADSPEDWPYTPTGLLLYNAKYAQQPAAAASLGSNLTKHVQAHPGMRSVDVVVAIPPSGRFPYRPNLPATWAKEISRALNLKPRVAITRTRSVSSQKEITDLDERRANQYGSMVANAALAGSRVLLVDDLYTGGETMNEGCRALRAAGASVVFGLAVAKTVKGSQGFWH